MVGQPAEETLSGAAAMLADGLFTRFPKPDYAVAIHDFGYLPSGQIGVVPGYALANVSTVEVTFYGKGGHGSAPHATIDPIVMASRAVVAFQTIVAREVNPLEHAVISVGSFHSGTKANIIPDEAKLQITVRSYKPEAHQQLLAAIARIAKGEAIAAGATREPLVWIVVAAFFLGFLYLAIPTALTGRTLGKRIQHLKTLREDGSPLGLRGAVVRFGLIVLVTFVLYFVLQQIAAVIVLFGVTMWMRNPNMQGVHDRFAHTIVVSDAGD